MSVVFKTKVLPRFIVPFTLVAKKGFAYTLNLLRKLRTHPVFYVGLLKPYREPSQVNQEALASRKLALPQLAASELGDQDGPLSFSDLFLTQQASLHHVKRVLGLTQSLAKIVHLLNQVHMGRSRHTDRSRRCLTSKGTFNSVWRGYCDDVVVTSNTSIW